MSSTNPYLAAFADVPPTPTELMNVYRSNYFAQLGAGVIRPLVNPAFLCGYALLYGYLCVPHVDSSGKVNRLRVYAARWVVFGIIVCINVRALYGERTLSFGVGFGNGLLSAWTVIWSAAWLVFDDPQQRARRVERRFGRQEVFGNRSTQARVDALHDDAELRQRHGFVQNGCTTNGADNGKSPLGTETAKEECEYYWQTYPVDSIPTRLQWVADLVFNFRGPGWNWEAASNPGLPPYVCRALGEKVTSKGEAGISSAGIRRFSSRREMIMDVVPQLVVGYLLLDVLKVTLMKDPFFICGPNTYPLPPKLASLHPLTLDLFRKLLSGTSIVMALQTAFILSPLCFCIILGPRVLGVRGELWMYPTTWGSLEAITRKGLAGLWGGWWHQTFRIGFEAPTRFCIRKGWLVKGSIMTKVVGIFFAFTISGMLHAAGSMTTLVPTKPWYFLVFFELQAVGIILQTGLAVLLRGPIQHTPLSLRKTGNMVIVLAWLYLTSSWLIDDFSKAIWHFEPVPFSIMRGLGFGYPGEGWIARVDPFNSFWYNGSHWWNTGIAF